MFQSVLLICALVSCASSRYELDLPEDENQQPFSIFYKIFGLPITDCNTGRNCFYQFLEARPNIRFRIVTNDILDRFNEKYHTKNQLENEQFELEEEIK